MGSPLSVNPPSITMGTSESLPLTIDFGPQLSYEEVLVSPVSNLEDTTNPNVPVNVPLIDSPNLSGALVAQQVRGSSLSAGHTYRLVLSVTVSGTLPSKIWSAELDIYCPW